MKDQVRQMTERNVSAVCVGDAESTTETQVCEGQFQLVYISPEALLTNPTWRDMLQSSVYHSNLVSLIVDEAHCVKKWLVIVLSFLITMLLFYVIVCQNIYVFIHVRVTLSEKSSRSLEMFTASSQRRYELWL